ncbi:hypothetical protein L486_01250 [Kwoniella mangroviensis CBS 10435]|uniref:Uncharacterized protein n=1 Tax=Kwoniella mangroviensis CBS 10435 TaxID=1331196 RepID=A0A1B9J1C7_9TREE|nr:hypothetical protein L486_01250 [Kwoniella mangroviensis CBS 10435]
MSGNDVYSQMRATLAEFNKDLYAGSDMATLCIDMFSLEEGAPTVTDEQGSIVSREGTLFNALTDKGKAAFVNTLARTTADYNDSYKRLVDRDACISIKMQHVNNLLNGSLQQIQSFATDPYALE